MKMGKNIRKINKVNAMVLVMIMLFSISYFGNGIPVYPGAEHKSSSPPSSTIVLDDGTKVNISPDEILWEYDVASGVWKSYSGIGAGNPAGQYANRTVSYEDIKIHYDPASGTSYATPSVPIGKDWTGYYMDAHLTHITENRTWVTNPGFQGSATGWTLGTSDAGSANTMNSFWEDDGHGTNDDDVRFTIDGRYSSGNYWYDNGDHVYARQTVTVDRGTITWMAFSMDYQAETRDTTHYGMTGSFVLYMIINSTNVNDRDWTLAFSQIGAENVWYNTGLINLDPSLLDLDNGDTFTIEIGLLTTQSVGYNPDILPAARIDNVKLYMKTKVAPSQINLKMNSLTVNDGAIYGTGAVSQSYLWTGTSAIANFTWTPSPNPPDPDLYIEVEFDVSLNLYARNEVNKTVYAADPSAIGENFEISNGSDASWSSYFLVQIPVGYEDDYFYNLTIPTTRDVRFVAKPLDPNTNLTSGWSGGDYGDGYLNVSVDTIPFADKIGFWPIKGVSPNMITNLEIYDSSTSTWSKTGNFRAGDSIQIRAYVGTSFNGDKVNFTIFAPDGSVWATTIATVSSGIATTGVFNLAGSNASAGEWTIQAYTNSTVSAGGIYDVGFFLRKFTVTHATALSVVDPSDASSDWNTNVTYGDLVLLRIRAHDTDSGILVPSGVMTYNWTTGTEYMDDNGNGEYATILNTTQLGSNGKFVIRISWQRQYFDAVVQDLIIYVYYESHMSSPQYPGVSGPKGWNISFNVYLEDQMGNPISNAPLSCNWSANAYTIYPITGSPGHYKVELNTSSVELKSYVVDITFAKEFYHTVTLSMYVTVHELYTSFTTSANYLPIPLGEAVSINLTYWDIDHDEPITGAVSNITANWTSYHSLGDPNYTLTELGNGVYNMTFYTVNTDPLKSWTVAITVSRYGCQNHTIYITIEVRSHATSFTLDEPVSQTAYGSNITVLVYYYDADLDEGIANGTANGHNVLIYVVIPEVASPIYYVANATTGDGHYNITIPTAQWGSIGWKEFTVYVNWTGAEPKYENKTLTIRVRITGTQTDLYIGQSPGTIYYLDNITFTVIYYDVVNSTGIVNSTGLYPGNVHLYVVVLNPGETVSQSDFVIAEVDPAGSPGEYSFTLNSSLLMSYGTYQFRIYANWTRGQSPLYENKTMIVTVMIQSRPTYISFNPIPTTPYAEIGNLTFTFVDVLKNEFIRNSSSITVSIVEGNVIYSVVYLGDDTGKFVVMINASSWNNIGTFTFHLSVTWSGAPFYANQTYEAIQIVVIRRHTQLSHGGYQPVQYGNIIDIPFTFTDLESGSSSNMYGGIITLNDTLAGWYTVDDNGDGTYVVHLNTTILNGTGLFGISVHIAYTGTNFCNNATDFLYITVVGRSTQLGYEFPEDTPYLELVNISVSYSDDTTGAGISNALVVISCDTSAEVLVKDVNYWVQDNGNGWYLISISSVALGSVDTFAINVTISKSGSPYYQTRSKIINVNVVHRPVDLHFVKTPADVPFNENITFIISYSDYLNGSGLSIDKSNIIIGHGPSNTILASGDYSLTGSNGVYTISINTSIFSSTTLLNRYLINVTVVWGNVVPYYDTRSIQATFSTTRRPTEVLIQEVTTVPYGDNLSITLLFRDYINSKPINNAQMYFVCLNKSSIINYTIALGNGLYRLIVPSGQFNKIGNFMFVFSLNVSDIAPFYSNITTSAIPATVRAIQMKIQADIPEPASIPVGDPIIINLTLTDIDHNVPIIGATISSNWTELYHTSTTVAEIGNGVYQLTINTTGLGAIVYSFNVYANKYLYANITSRLSIQPGAIPMGIVLTKTTYTAYWGDLIQIDAYINNTYANEPVLNVTLTLIWNTNEYNFTELGNGYYRLILDTSTNPIGTYVASITAAKTNHQTRITQINVVVYKAESELITEHYSISVIEGVHLPLWVFYNQTNTGQPIVGANITYSIGNVTGTMAENGTAGFYVANIDTSPLSIGTYVLTVSASIHDRVDATIYITVRVTPIPTTLNVLNGQLIYDPIYTDTLSILVYFNDTAHNLAITHANVTYKTTGLEGSLNEFGSGWYSVTIDTTTLSVGTFFLTIRASKPGYSVATITITINIQDIPTKFTALNSTITEYYGRNVTFYLRYNDTHNDVPVENADATFTWDGGSGTLTELGNGLYYFTINTGAVVPGDYNIKIRFAKSNYRISTGIVTLVVNEIPTTIIANYTYTVPVTVAKNLTFTYKDILNNETIPNAFAIASWIGGITQLYDLGNGTYVFPVLSTLKLGIYTLDLTFEKTNYSRSTAVITLKIVPIPTSLTTPKTSIESSPGAYLSIRVTYWDTFHNVGISNATVTINADNNRVEVDYNATIDYNNGTYVIYLHITGQGSIPITIGLAKENYEPQSIQVTVISQISEAQAAAVRTMFGAGIAILFISLFVIVYVKVLSVPKEIRVINRLIKSLSKGKIPKAPLAPSRGKILLHIVNEFLAPYSITKTDEDIEPETIKIEIPELDDLLRELAELTDLGPEEIEAFKQDLYKMRPSERVGFVKEVIKQEQARRAEEIAKRKAESAVEVPKEAEKEDKLSPEELDEMRRRLMEMGMDIDEIELVVEQARELSRADAEELLKTLGLK